MRGAKTVGKILKRFAKTPESFRSLVRKSKPLVRLSKKLVTRRNLKWAGATTAVGIVGYHVARYTRENSGCFLTESDGKRLCKVKSLSCCSRSTAPGDVPFCGEGEPGGLFRPFANAAGGGGGGGGGRTGEARVPGEGSEADDGEKTLHEKEACRDYDADDADVTCCSYCDCHYHDCGGPNRRMKCHTASLKEAFEKLFKGVSYSVFPFADKIGVALVAILAVLIMLAVVT